MSEPEETQEIKDMPSEAEEIPLAFEEVPSSKEEAEIPSVSEKIELSEPEEMQSDEAALAIESEKKITEKVEAPKIEDQEVLVSPVVHKSPVQKLPSEIVPREDPISQVGLEMQVAFLLEQQRLSLERIRALAVGETITFSGSDFKVTLLLQGKAIAEAQQVLVDGRPAVQITKIL